MDRQGYNYTRIIVLAFMVSIFVNRLFIQSEDELKKKEINDAFF